jgi:hypothetical protein
MNRQEELLERFFSQIPRGKEPTAQDIKDAVAAAGTDTSLINDIVVIYAEAQGIDAKNELTELYNARATAKNEKAKAEQHEKVKKACEEFGAGTITLDDLHNRIKEAQAETTSSNETQRQRFSTYEGLLEKLRKDEPEKDFTSSLLCNLRCPKGTMSVIAA